ncbi:uncharacterized protein BDV17DRAFT_258962 [Aspergillus undulatus]|uniref:uncharacterized protein n=1 Tax=Aspergillus undulatus TaxID=1810928 RepID=UPI003CCDC02D
MLAIQRTSISNVLLCRVRVNPEPLCYLSDALWAECTLRVDVGYFAFCTAHVFGELCDDGHGVGELCLAAAELAEYFANAHALEAAATVSDMVLRDTGYVPSEDRVKLLAAG